MATFDQLAADQRAIIEIVLRQGKSYDQIGEMLDLPPSRVRELAREALAELAPTTADLVDPQWRGQVADYILGEQTGPEAQATRGHLKRSEPARIWAYSLLDALADFYDAGSGPEIPAGEAGGGRSRTRAAAANGDEAGSPLASPRRTRAGGTLSPEAQSALRRRRILGAIAGLVVIALLVFAATQIFGGDDGKGGKTAGPAGTTSTGASNSQSQGQGQGQVVAQAVLAPIGKSFKGTGAALVYQSGKQALAVVRAKLPASTGKNKYVLWLYNSEKQLAPLAADVTDKQGNFQGAAALPNGWENYRFFDLSYQSTSGKNVRHGRSVMRGPITQPQQSSGSGGATGTGTETSTTP